MVPKYRRNERYPKKLLVAMDDGHVIHYRIDVEQTEPHFLTVMDILRSLPVYSTIKYRRKKEPGP